MPRERQFATVVRRLVREAIRNDGRLTFDGQLWLRPRRKAPKRMERTEKPQRLLGFHRREALR